MSRRHPFRSRRLPRVVLAGLFAVTLLPASVAAQPADEQGVYTITGAIDVAESLETDFDEAAVVLLDLSVDYAVAPSPESQVMAQLAGDPDDERVFTMPLPARPLGGTVDITGGDERDAPQVYSVDVVANTSGTQFLEESDFYGGAPGLYSSLTFGTDGLTGEVLVWSSGDGEVFPVGRGDDGEPLTPDDPVEELEPGWTLVDIGDDDYGFTRDEEETVTFADAVDPNDFSDLGWVEAFDALVDQLQAEYAFTDIKDIDFDALREEYRPRVEDAERDEDVDAYDAALFDFGLAFHDGHVSATYPVASLLDRYDATFGLEIGQTDDGEVIVTGITGGRAADDEGIEVGDRVTAWAGEEIGGVLEDMEVPLPWSSEHVRAGLATTWLTRGAVGDEVEVTVRDEDGEERTVDLRATRDLEGFDRAFSSPWSSDPGAMPIESRILPSGVGYIRIDTFATNFVLFTHQWDYAIRTLQDYGVSELVIDVRANGGGYNGLWTYAAATFVEEPLHLNDALMADGDGGYEPVFENVVPTAPRHWTGSVAVIVDGSCASSCEFFSATLARIDSDIVNVVGYTPSAGVFATIESWDLPADLYFQASSVRYELDGEVHIEGQGVAPDVDVPVTEASLLGDDDELLGIAEEVATGQYEPDED